MTAALLGFWAAALAVHDALRRRVPNAALLAVLVPAVLVLAFREQGLLGTGRLDSLAGAAIVLALTLPGYALRGLGAGDVKLAAVFGLLLGARRGLEMVVLAMLLLGVCAALLLLWRRSRQMRFPAVPVLAAAFVAEMLGGPWLLA